MNTLRHAIADYLKERRGKGRKLREAGYTLLRFASFMEKRRASYITARLALEWIQQSNGITPATRAGYMDSLRQFARFRQATDPRTEIPPYGLCPHPPRVAGTGISAESASRRSRSLPKKPASSDCPQGLLAAAYEYVDMRRTLGFKFKRAGAALIHFATFMEERGADYVTIQLALEWAQSPPNSKPATWAQRLSFVRLFARHRSAVDPRTEIPQWRLLPHQTKRRANPYFYTDKEIEKLLAAALNIRIYNSAGLLKRQTYYCLFGLLAVSGMRVGEAVGLKLGHVDLEAGVLHIEGAKFGQSRLIPVHSSTKRALSAYRKFRDDFLAARKCNSDHFFVTQFGKPLDSGDIHRRFYALSHMIGIREKNASVGPRIHDLRHRFAMETLRKWYRAGKDVERKLPLLSTYLGHIQAKDTYWYFTACPELMGAAIGLVERRWEGTP